MPDSFMEIERCLLGSTSLEETRLCLQALRLENIEPEDLGRWVCATDAPPHVHSVVAQEVMALLQPGDFLAYANEFQAACGRYKESTFLIGCLEYGKKVNPAWYEGVVASVTPSILFDEGTSEAAIQICEYIAGLPGGEYAKMLLEEGGKGYWGGTSDQVFRSAIIAAYVQDSPSSFLGYITDVLRTPGNENVWDRMAPLFTTYLLSPRAWQDGDSRAALSTMMQALQDSRYGPSVAMYLTTFYMEEPPSGCDPDLWATLWEYAVVANMLRADR